MSSGWADGEQQAPQVDAPREIGGGAAPRRVMQDPFFQEVKARLEELLGRRGDDRAVRFSDLQGVITRARDLSREAMRQEMGALDPDEIDSRIDAAMAEAAAALLAANNAGTAASEAFTLATNVSNWIDDQFGAEFPDVTTITTDAELARDAAQAAQTAAEAAQAAAATSATSANSSAGVATTKASEASASATSASASAATAATLRDEAAGSAGAASTSATAAQTSADAAGISAGAAQTARTAAEASQGAAAGSASAAATSATNAGASATSAGNSASTATTARNEAIAARDAASGSASASSTNASNAEASATDAGNAATASQSARTAAEAARDTAQSAASTAVAQASAASDSAAAASVSATAAASLNGGSFADPIFAQWGTASSAVRWVGQGAVTVNPPLAAFAGGKSLEFTLTAAQADGIVVKTNSGAWRGTKDAGGFVLEATFGSNGPTVHLGHSWVNTAGQVFFDWISPYDVVQSGAAAQFRLRSQWLVKRPAGATGTHDYSDFYVLFNWAAVGGADGTPVGGTALLDEFRIRPATAEEMGGGEVGAVIAPVAATANTALDVATTTEAALGQITSTVNAEHGSWTAFAEDTKRAVATADEVAAKQFLGVVAGSAGASLELLAFDGTPGTGSVITLNADDVFVDGTLSTSKLVVTDLTGNLIPNGAFVFGDLRGWQFVPAQFSLTTIVGSPTSHVLQSVGGVYHIANIARDIPIKAGERFVPSFEHRGPSGATGVWRILLGFSDATGTTSYQWRDAQPDTSDTWPLAEFPDVVAPAGAQKLDIWIERQPGSGTAYATRFQVLRQRRGTVLLEPGSVTAEQITVASLDALSANLGSIVVGEANIADANITRLKIAGQAVDITKLQPETTSSFRAAVLLNKNIDTGSPELLLDVTTPNTARGTAAKADLILDVTGQVDVQGYQSTITFQGFSPSGESRAATYLTLTQGQRQQVTLSLAWLQSDDGRCQFRVLSQYPGVGGFALIHSAALQIVQVTS